MYKSCKGSQLKVKDNFPPSTRKKSAGLEEEDTVDLLLIGMENVPSGRQHESLILRSMNSCIISSLWVAWLMSHSRREQEMSAICIMALSWGIPWKTSSSWWLRATAKALCACSTESESVDSWMWARDSRIAETITTTLSPCLLARLEILCRFWTAATNSWWEAEESARETRRNRNAYCQGRCPYL